MLVFVQFKSEIKKETKRSESENWDLSAAGWTDSFAGSNPSNWQPATLERRLWMSSVLFETQCGWSSRSPQCVGARGANFFLSVTFAARHV